MNDFVQVLSDIGFWSLVWLFAKIVLAWWVARFVVFSIPALVAIVISRKDMWDFPLFKEDEIAAGVFRGMKKLKEWERGR